MRPVGAIGAQRGGSVGIAGERRGLGERRPARLCQSRLDCRCGIGRHDQRR